MGLARGSRNAGLARYRRTRAEQIKRDIADGRQDHKNKLVNSRSLAIQRSPDLFGRARGRRVNETDSSPTSRRQLVHGGDEEKLKEIMAVQKIELGRDAGEIRKAALARKKQRTGRSLPLPLTNRDWLLFVKEILELFRETYRLAPEKRRSLAERVVPMEGMNEQVPRLRPVEILPRAQWYQALVQECQGFFTLRSGGVTCTFFLVPSVGSLGGVRLRKWAVASSPWSCDRCARCSNQLRSCWQKRGLTP